MIVCADTVPATNSRPASSTSVAPTVSVPSTSSCAAASSKMRNEAACAPVTPTVNASVPPISAIVRDPGTVPMFQLVPTAQSPPWSAIQFATCAIGTAPRRVGSALGRLQIDADAQRVLAAAEDDATDRAHVGEIAAPAEHHVLLLHDQVVVIEIDAVTHRRAPIFHTIVGGGDEHILLGAVTREASFLATMQRVFPNVVNLHLSRGGVGRYHLWVQMKKTFEGGAKNVMFSAFSMHHDIKQVVVVDEDVDIFEPTEVEWALATRFQADRGLMLVDHARASKLDPTSRGGVGAKLGMDATRPLDAAPTQFLRIQVPGRDAVDTARELLAGSDAAAWRRFAAD